MADSVTVVKSTLDTVRGHWSFMLGNVYAQCIVGISLRQSKGEGEGSKTEKRKKIRKERK